MQIKKYKKEKQEAKPSPTRSRDQSIHHVRERARGANWKVGNRVKGLGRPQLRRVNLDGLWTHSVIID